MVLLELIFHQVTLQLMITLVFFKRVIVYFLKNFSAFLQEVAQVKVKQDLKVLKLFKGDPHWFAARENKEVLVKSFSIRIDISIFVLASLFRVLALQSFSRVIWTHIQF